MNRNSGSRWRAGEAQKPHSRLHRSLSDNFGQEGVEALAEAIDKGMLPGLRQLVMSDEHKHNPRLRAACMQRGIGLA